MTTMMSKLKNKMTRLKNAIRMGLARKRVSIFIEDAGIRVLVMKRNLPVKWASAELEPDLVSQGTVLDVDAVAQKVRELLKAEKIRAGRVVAGISGLNSLYRSIVLPEVPASILGEAIRHEAKRVMPISLDEVHLVHQRLPGPAGETRIFLAAFPRKVADALFKTLRQAGLTPNAADLVPLALARIPNKPRAIIVDMRSGLLAITIVADRLPQPIRTIALPRESRSALDNLTAITEELTRTVAFFNSSHQQNPIDSTVPLFVSGDLEGAANTWAALAGGWKFPVSPLSSLVQPVENLPASQFLVNVGLSRRDPAYARENEYCSAVDLDALPAEYRPPAAVSAPNVLAPVGAVIAAVLIVGAAAMVRDNMRHTETLRLISSDINDQVAQERKEATALRQQIPQEATALKGQILQVETTLNLQIKQVEASTAGVTTERNGQSATVSALETRLAAFDKERKRVDQSLDNLVSVALGKVLLTQVDHQGDRVNIAGLASDESQVFAYARALRSSSGVSAVTVTSIAYQAAGEEGGSGQFGFTIVLRLAG